MARAELAVAQWEISITAKPLIEYLHMPRAIHRLDRVITILRCCREHVLLVIFPVPRTFPKAAIQNLRTTHFLVAMIAIHTPHVLLDSLPDRPSLGMPENHAWGLFLKMEKIQLRADLAVIALFGFLEHVQIGILLILFGPGRPVNTLQHLVARIPAPIGAGNFHQLEHFQLAGRRHVRAATQVDKITLPVERYILARRNGADDFGLVVLTDRLEEIDRLVARKHLSRYREIMLGQFGHFLFDGRQIFWCKGPRIREVVVEAALDDRTDGDLCFRK